MPEPTATEITRARIDKPAAPPTTDSERRAESLRTILENSQRADRPQDAFEQIFREQDAVDHVKSDRVINQTIDTRLDASTVAGPSRGVDRVSAAKEVRDLAEKYLEPMSFRPEASGGLTAAQRDIIREQIRDVIMAQDGGRGIIGDYISRGGAELDAFLDRWATDPDFREVVRDLKREIIDDPPDVDTVQQAIAAAEKAATEKQEEITGPKGVDKKLEEFQDDAGGTRTKGPKLVAMEAQDTARTSAKGTYDGEVATLNSLLAKYGGSYLGDGQINLGSDVLQAMKRSDRDKILIDASKLKNSPYEVADRKYNTLLQEQTGLEADKVRLTAELTAANTTLSEAKNARAQMEQDYVDRLANLYKTAMEQYMTERQGKLPDALAAARVESGSGAEAMKAALEHSYTEFFEEAPRYHDGRVERKPNIAAINLAVDMLTSTPEHFALTYLGYAGRINPATGINYVEADIAADPTIIAEANRMRTEQLMRRILMTQENPANPGHHYTSADIDAVLVADPDFVKNNQGGMVAEVVRRAMINKKLTEAQVNSIMANHEFGGETLIQSILNNPDVQERLRNQGFDFLPEGLKKAMQDNLWQVLIALFLGGPYGLVGFLAVKGGIKYKNHLQRSAVANANQDATIRATAGAENANDHHAHGPGAAPHGAPASAHGTP